MKIGIIGGGVTGLSAGYELVRKGHKITIFEKEGRIGGLAGSFRVGEVWLEKFYHHIFKSDVAIIGLVEELGLGGRLVWRASPMGFFHRGEIYRFGTPLELLRFSPLSLADRVKLGLAVLKFQRMKNWEHLDRITCREWFSEHVSPQCYEIVWEPLLRLKFGKAHEEIPAAWIWGRIHPRARSRSRGGMREELGYLSGGFQLLFDRMRDEIVANGGSVREKTPVEYIIQENGTARGVVAGGEEFFFDRIISTVAIPAFLEIAPPLPEEYQSRLEAVRYQAVVCLVMECEKPLSPIYWLNISDPGITFGGVIEQTNFISTDQYAGRHIIYVFNYVSEDHPCFSMSREDYFALHEESLRRINPSFRRERVRKIHLFHARYGTPIYTLGYIEKMPPFRMPFKNLYMANTSQIYPYDRNMNNCAALGRRVAKKAV